MTNKTIDMRSLIIIAITFFWFGLNAQTFTQVTGTSNPCDGFDVDRAAAPRLVDIDNDDDLDLFVGEKDGNINYYKNTGSNSAPVFLLKTGNLNPFNGVDVGSYSIPAFVDIDNNNTLDAFIGEGNIGNFYYYKNTGSVSSATFTNLTGSSNPLDGASQNYSASVDFAKIDGDNDYDAFIGELYYGMNYYKNTGSASSPTFSEKTGSANPMNSLSSGFAAPVLGDVNNDGLIDLVIGQDYKVSYYKNTGTASNPAFTFQFNIHSIPEDEGEEDYFIPALGDIDDDGDLDLLIGQDDGTMLFYENNLISLPVELISFSATQQDDNVVLNWQTASELNNSHFEVEFSTNGIDFEKIGTIKGAGTTLENQVYGFIDELNRADFSTSSWGNRQNQYDLYYRLKQVDFGEQFEYSKIVIISSPFSIVNFSLDVFPNPTSGLLSLNGPLENAQIRVFNQLGQVILEQNEVNHSTHELNLSGLSNGVYYLQIQQGEQVFLEKIVLE